MKAMRNGDKEYLVLGVGVVHKSLGHRAKTKLWAELKIGSFSLKVNCPVSTINKPKQKITVFKINRPKRSR